LTNSVKHAFPPEFNKNVEKNIEVFLRQNNEIIEFGVQDNGKGLPENMSIVQGQTLGFELITILVKQLKGTIEFSSGEKGAHTMIEIRFTPLLQG
ncbi:MAG: hypothetical protein K9L68_14905, partial [Spirochaetales bacterium]|nr:hypothetical protein [Spirochaetales bacterium]